MNLLLIFRMRTIRTDKKSDPICPLNNSSEAPTFQTEI